MTDSMVGGWTSHFNYPSWTVCRFCDLFAEQRESCHNLFYFFFFFTNGSYYLTKTRHILIWRHMLSNTLMLKPCLGSTVDQILIIFFFLEWMFSAA